MPDVKRVSVAAHRVPVQRAPWTEGLFRCAEKPTASRGARVVFVDPLRDVPLPSKPRRVIYEATDEGDGPRIGPPPKDDHEYEGGMSVCVGNGCEDELYDEVLPKVNNVCEGRGAALLNAEYWHWLKGRKGPAPGEEPVASQPRLLASRVDRPRPESSRQTQTDDE